MAAKSTGGRWAAIVENDKGRLMALKRTYPTEKKAWEAAQRKDREMHGEFWPSKVERTERPSGFIRYEPFKVRSVGVAHLKKGQSVGVLEL